MKFVLKNTAYRGDTETVEELYVRTEDSVYLHTDKLSEARVWDTFDEAADIIEESKTDDHKIVLIKEKDLFEARLNGK